MFLILAAFAYCGLIAAFFAAIYGAGQLAARTLRVPDFRWFDGAPAPAALAPRALVRFVSALAPFSVAVALLWAGLLLGGERVPTTTVTVLEGPAQRAGLRDGDRILAIDGQRMSDWDSIRNNLKIPSERTLEIERRGARLTLRVTPDSQGRIRIMSQDENRPYSVGAAFSRAVQSIPLLLRQQWLRFERIASADERADFTGPIGIIKHSNETKGAAGFLLYLGWIAAYFCPYFAALPLFDALSLWLFTKTSSAASPAPRTDVRLARIAHTLWISLGATVFVYVLAGFSLLHFADEVSAPLLLPFLPADLALWPMIGIAGGLLWGRGRAALLLAPATVVPCATPILALVLALSLRRRLGASATTLHG